MKKLSTLLCAAVAILTTTLSCNDFKSLQADISDLKDRVGKIEDQMRLANDNISGLQNVVGALSRKVYVESVKEITDGYEIKFSDNTSATLKNGVSSIVGVNRHQGVYYWTINGEWLLDRSGQMIPVTGTAPQLKIENDYWYISTDGGTTWEKLNKATGDSFLKDIKWDDNFVYIVLADGTKIDISRGPNGVKAITAVPSYTDGSVYAERSEFTVCFDVIPADAAASLAAINKDFFELKLVYTITKSAPGDKTVLPVKKIEAKDGQLLITTDGSSLDEQLSTDGPLGANATLNICDGANGITSGYFPLQFKCLVVKFTDSDDLQTVIDDADDGAEIRVPAGVELVGPVYLRNNVKLSGGWVNDYTSQDFSKRSCIDGQDKDLCVRSEGEGNAVLSGFEIKRGSKSGILVTGKLTVEYCWIHNCFNDGQGGAICCTEKKGDELMLANSIIEYNKADAHGGALAINGPGTKVTVVNCLFRGNASIAQYGYTGAIHCQAGVSAYLCNNTIVENVNWRDGSSAEAPPWSAVMFRNYGTHVEFVNNIVAGNWYFLPGVASDDIAHPDRYDLPIKPKYLLEMQVRSIDMNEIGASDLDYVCRSNILGGTNSSRFIDRAGSDKARSDSQAACIFVNNDNYDTIFKNASSGNFKPSGSSFGLGEDSELVRKLLGPYTKDLAGKDRFSGGKIYIGCYQP